MMNLQFVFEVQGQNIMDYDNMDPTLPFPSRVKSK